MREEDATIACGEGKPFLIVQPGQACGWRCF
jgi:hypothetical protein